MVHRVLPTFIVIALFNALIAFTPHNTQAMGFPGVGDYTFTAGLTGSFHSDGTQLTTWEFLYDHPLYADLSDPGNLDPFTRWKDTEDGVTQFVFDNNALNSLQFIAVQGLPADFILIDWNSFTFASPWTHIRDGQGNLIPDSQGDPVLTNLPFSIAQASVPEPSSALLLLVSLAVLVGYRWRQQHPTAV